MGCDDDLARGGKQNPDPSSHMHLVGRLDGVAVEPRRRDLRVSD